MFDRVVNMFERDKNHPSIIIWSLGNECGFAPIHMALSYWLRAKDTQRVVQYEGGRIILQLHHSVAYNHSLRGP